MKNKDLLLNPRFSLLTLIAVVPLLTLFIHLVAFAFVFGHQGLPSLVSMISDDQTEIVKQENEYTSVIHETISLTIPVTTSEPIEMVQTLVEIEADEYSSIDSIRVANVIGKHHFTAFAHEILFDQETCKYKLIIPDYVKGIYTLRGYGKGFDGDVLDFSKKIYKDYSQQELQEKKEREEMEKRKAQKEQDGLIASVSKSSV